MDSSFLRPRFMFNFFPSASANDDNCPVRGDRVSWINLARAGLYYSSFHAWNNYSDRWRSSKCHCLPLVSSHTTMLCFPSSLHLALFCIIYISHALTCLNTTNSSYYIAQHILACMISLSSPPGVVGIAGTRISGNVLYFKEQSTRDNWKCHLI